MNGYLIYASSRRGRRAAVVLPWERRGDFQKLLAELERREDAPDAPLSWKRVKKRTLRYHLDVLAALETRRWLQVAATAAAIDEAVPTGAPARWRVEDEEIVPEACLATAKVVDRKSTPGLRLARFLARALGQKQASPAKREVARAARALAR